MSKPYAVIDVNGSVTNVIMWDGAEVEGVPTWVPPENHAAVQIDNAVIGGTYLNGVYAAPVQPAPPSPTPAHQAAALLASGLELKSTGTPALNGTYSVTVQSIANVSNVTTYILKNNKFPAGVTQMPWVDKDGNPHLFPTVETFENFATAFGDFVAACQIFGDSNGQAGSLPSNQITIP